MSEEKVGPVDHISRRALPWRTDAELTECGKSVTDVGGRIVPRSEILSRIQRIGRKRAAFTTCMTCAETSDRQSRRDRDDDVNVISREAGAVNNATEPPPPPEAMDGPHHVWRSSREWRNYRDLWRRRQRLSAELEAISALVEAHREEFDDYLAGLDETVSLASRRTARRHRTGGAS